MVSASEAPGEATLLLLRLVELDVGGSTDPEPVIEATANDHTVTYRPTPEEPPGCD